MNAASFPLFQKGVDRYRFEYALFLLGKDLEQILYCLGVRVSDFKNMLQNLTLIYATVESTLLK